MESETKLKFFTPQFLFLKIEFHFPNLLCDLLRNPLRLNQDGIGEGGRGGGAGGEGYCSFKSAKTFALDGL